MVIITLRASICTIRSHTDIQSKQASNLGHPSFNSGGVPRLLASCQMKLAACKHFAFYYDLRPFQQHR